MGPDADGAAQDTSHPARAAGRQREHYESRSLLVARVAQQLSHDAAPRLHLSIILVLAGGAAFLSTFTSVSAHHVGDDAFHFSSSNRRIAHASAGSC